MNAKQKIGIITFHNALNYGAVLQAFALQNTLSFFSDAEIINYHSFNMEHKNDSFIIKVKRFIKSAINLFSLKNNVYYVIKKRHNFNDFVKNYLSISKRKYNSKNIAKANNLYDSFITGSDQVWNYNLTRGDWNYFLPFASPEKKNSYAASFGGCKIDEHIKSTIRNMLFDYSSISIREKSGIEIIENCGVCKTVEIVCDPVFLIPKQDWIQKLSLERKKEKYIFVYIVTKPKNLFKLALNLSKKYNLKIILVNSNAKSIIKDIPKNIINKSYVGPKEFVNLIFNSDFVLTTSFHAIAFSLIFNKTFYYELDSSIENNNSRIINLENVFKIENRRIKTENCFNDSMIDWRYINSKILDQSDYSIRFIKDKIIKHEQQ